MIIAIDYVPQKLNYMQCTMRIRTSWREKLPRISIDIRLRKEHSGTFGCGDSIQSSFCTIEVFVILTTLYEIKVYNVRVTEAILGRSQHDKRPQ